MAVRLCAVPNVEGGKRRCTDLGPVAGGTSRAETGADLVAVLARRPPRRVNAEAAFLHVCPMAGVHAVASGESLWGIQTSLSDGGYSVRGRPIQRRRVGESIAI